jgi:hypothetical protein
VSTIIQYQLLRLLRSRDWPDPPAALKLEKITVVAGLV